MKTKCIKCGVMNNHAVRYYGRTLDVGVVTSIITGKNITITPEGAHSDEFLSITCACCGYEHIEKPKSDLFDDNVEF